MRAATTKITNAINGFSRQVLAGAAGGAAAILEPLK
jgi:hypothetical protein